MNDRTTNATARKQLAGDLREIRRSVADPDYARGLCRAVLVNFYTGMAAVPRRCNGKWYPRRRRGPASPAESPPYLQPRSGNEARLQRLRFDLWGSGLFDLQGQNPLLEVPTQEE